MNFLNIKPRFLIAVSLAVTVLGITINDAKADRLADVKKAGVLHCGIVPGMAGYANTNKEGKTVGFDIYIDEAKQQFEIPGTAAIKITLGTTALPTDAKPALSMVDLLIDERDLLCWYIRKGERKAWVGAYQANSLDAAPMSHDQQIFDII